MDSVNDQCIARVIILSYPQLTLPFVVYDHGLVAALTLQDISCLF